MCHVSCQYSDNTSSISRYICAKNNDDMPLLLCACFCSCNQARCIVLDECRHHLSIPSSCALSTALVCSYRWTVIHHHHAGYATDTISSVSQIQYTRGTNWGNVLNIRQHIKITHTHTQACENRNITLNWEIQNKSLKKSATKPQWRASLANKLA